MTDLAFVVFILKLLKEFSSSAAQYDSMTIDQELTEMALYKFCIIIITVTD